MFGPSWSQAIHAPFDDILSRSHTNTFPGVSIYRCQSSFEEQRFSWGFFKMDLERLMFSMKISQYCKVSDLVNAQISFQVEDLPQVLGVVFLWLTHLPVCIGAGLRSGVVGPNQSTLHCGNLPFFLAFGSPPLLIQLVHCSRGHFTSLLADHHTLTSPVIAESLGSCKQLATLNLRTRCKRCSPRRTTTTAPRFELNQLASTAPAHQYENFKKKGDI